MGNPHSWNARPFYIAKGIVLLLLCSSLNVHRESNVRWLSDRFDFYAMSSCTLESININWESKSSLNCWWRLFLSRICFYHPEFCDQTVCISSTTQRINSRFLVSKWIKETTILFAMEELFLSWALNWKGKQSTRILIQCKAILNVRVYLTDRYSLAKILLERKYPGKQGI